MSRASAWSSRPEPHTYLMLGVGLLAIGAMRMWRLTPHWKRPAAHASAVALRSVPDPLICQPDACQACCVPETTAIGCCRMNMFLVRFLRFLPLPPDAGAGHTVPGQSRRARRRGRYRRPELGQFPVCRGRQPHPRRRQGGLLGRPDRAAVRVDRRPCGEQHAVSRHLHLQSQHRRQPDLQRSRRRDRCPPGLPRLQARPRRHGAQRPGRRAARLAGARRHADLRVA